MTAAKGLTKRETFKLMNMDTPETDRKGVIPVERNSL